MSLTTSGPHGCQKETHDADGDLGGSPRCTPGLWSRTVRTSPVFWPASLFPRRRFRQPSTGRGRAGVRASTLEEPLAGIPPIGEKPPRDRVAHAVIPLSSAVARRPRGPGCLANHSLAIVAAPSSTPGSSKKRLAPRRRMTLEAAPRSVRPSALAAPEGQRSARRPSPVKRWEKKRRRPGDSPGHSRRHGAWHALGRNRPEQVEPDGTAGGPPARDHDDGIRRRRVRENHLRSERRGDPPWQPRLAHGRGNAIGRAIHLLLSRPRGLHGRRVAVAARRRAAIPVLVGGFRPKKVAAGPVMLVHREPLRSTVVRGLGPGVE